MDKVLKHKFWILSGLALVLALVGYFLANGAINAAIDARIAEIEAISVPEGRVNESHTEVAKQLADAQAAGNDEQVRRLDGIQRSWMKWPKLIQDGLEVDPVTNEIVYRGPKLRREAIKNLYGQYYLQQMEELYHFVNPVIAPGSPYPSKNKVFLRRPTIPVHDIPSIASVQKIWDAQEDYWILKMLFTAIDDTNAAAQDVNSSPIRQILQIRLFGGTGEPAMQGGPAVALGGGDSMMSGGMVYDTGTFMDAGSTTGGIGGTNIAFDPAMEYGPSAGAAVAATDDAGNFLGGPASTELRYIKFDPANPGSYRRRGFYLSVLIDEKHIPDFIVNLANLDPPVAVGRWSFGNNPYDNDHLLLGRAPAPAAAPRGFGGRFGSPQGSGDMMTGFESDVRRFSGFGGGGAPGAAIDTTGLTPQQLRELEKYSAALVSNKNLVRLDLTGVVTLFTPQVPPVTPEPPSAPPTEAPPAEGTPMAPAPADGSPPPTEVPTPAPATPEDGPVPAPAGEAPEIPPATEPTTAAPAPMEPSPSPPAPM